MDPTHLRDMMENMDGKIFLDIKTKNSVESFQIDGPFTGQLILSFNQGGLAGALKQEDIRKTEKLR